MGPRRRSNCAWDSRPSGARPRRRSSRTPALPAARSLGARGATPLRNSDGSPTTSNPGLVDALPGPSTATGVPNFVIRKFRVPVFLLPIYQAAGIQYGVRWEILAAINEIETDYGRNLNVSSAGALGWMQFIPSSWQAYGVDANKDGRKDPYNPVDAIFAAARYLKAAGYEQDVRRSIFAYNHADWYVDSVMLRARLIAGVPADLVGSLTGLTEGRFPVAARARYADDLQEREALKRVKAGQNAANVIESNDDRRSVQIYTKKGAPVVATNDGQIKKIGANRKLGRYIVLQDVYGNRYHYTGLGTTAKYYPVPREEAAAERSARALPANGDSKPAAPASGGRQPDARHGLRRSGHTTVSTRPPSRSRSASSPARTCRGARVGRARAADGHDGEARGRLHQLRQPLRPADQARSQALPPAPPARGRQRDRRHRARPRGPPGGRQGRAPGFRHPARRPRRPPDRPQAHPRRLEAARGHRHLPRHREERASQRQRRLLDRPDPADAQAHARAPSARRRAHRGLRRRPRGHPHGPDRPPRAGLAGIPGRVGHASHDHQPQVRPRLLHQLGQRLTPQLRQRGGHRRDQRRARSSATRSRAGSPSRQYAG